MWVLDARYNAEKVWYPVIWEKTKEASDVIDYNINEEITVNTTAVFNANNDTTTGMAKNIPWVNDYRLINNTSIYQPKDWANWWTDWTISSELTRPDDNTQNLRNFTLSDSFWTLKYSVKTDPTLRWWVVIPRAWWYEISVTRPHWWSTYRINWEIRIARWWYWNDEVIFTHTWQNNTTVYTETTQHQFLWWDAVYVHLELIYTWSASSFYSNQDVSISIRKL